MGAMRAIALRELQFRFRSSRLTLSPLSLFLFLSASSAVPLSPFGESPFLFLLGRRAKEKAASSSHFLPCVCIGARLLRRATVWRWTDGRSGRVRRPPNVVQCVGSSPPFAVTRNWTRVERYLYPGKGACVLVLPSMFPSGGERTVVS